MVAPYALRTVVLVVLAASMGLLSGCFAKSHDLEWGFRFEDDNDAARALLVEGGIAEGGCRGPVLYDSTFLVADGASRMPAPHLAAGRYGLFGRARDRSCTWFLQGCVLIDLPTDDGPHIVTLGTSTPQADCPSDWCVEGSCDGDAPPDTDVDAGPPGSDVDADPPGSDVDSGSPGSDAGAVDGCIPSEETCDGTDEDCDLLIDEDFDLSSDRENCGSCGSECGGDRRCRRSHCERYQVADSCSSCPCDVCTGELDHCLEEGTSVLCYD